MQIKEFFLFEMEQLKMELSEEFYRRKLAKKVFKGFKWNCKYEEDMKKVCILLRKGNFSKADKFIEASKDIPINNETKKFTLAVNFCRIRLMKKCFNNFRQ